MKKLMAVLMAALMLLSCACAEEAFDGESLTLVSGIRLDLNDDAVIELAAGTGQLGEQETELVRKALAVTEALGGRISLGENAASVTLSLNEQPIMNVWCEYGAQVRLTSDLFPNYAFVLDTNEAAALMQQLMAASGMDLSQIDLSRLDLDASMEAYMTILQDFIATIPVETAEGIFPVNLTAYTEKTTITLQERALYRAVCAFTEQLKKDLDTVGLSAYAAQMLEAIDLPAEDQIGDGELKMYLYTAGESILFVPADDVEDAPFTLSLNGDTVLLTVPDYRQTVYFMASASDEKITLDLLKKMNYSSSYDSDTELRLDILPAADSLTANLMISASEMLINAALCAQETDDGLAATETLSLNGTDLITSYETLTVTNEPVQIPAASGDVTEIDVLKLITGETDANEVLANVVAEISSYGLSVITMRAYQAMPEVNELLSLLTTAQ